jgi:multiple sugar transport system ATP-binding protein
MPITVAVVEPLGSDTLVYFELDGQRHVARVSPKLAPRTGEKATLVIDAATVHLFNPQDGSVLG